MPMQPRPKAETFSPLLPNSLCSIIPPLKSESGFLVSEIIRLSLSTGSRAPSGLHEATRWVTISCGQFPKLLYGKARPARLHTRVGDGRIPFLRARLVAAARR